MIDAFFGFVDLMKKVSYVALAFGIVLLVSQAFLPAWNQTLWGISVCCGFFYWLANWKGFMLLQLPFIWFETYQMEKGLKRIDEATERYKANRRKRQETTGNEE